MTNSGLSTSTNKLKVDPRNWVCRFLPISHFDSKLSGNFEWYVLDSNFGSNSMFESWVASHVWS
jgi:hypothetical protein